MKTALALVYLSLIAAVIASGLDHSTFGWAALVVAVVVLFLAAILRVHAIINAPAADE